MPHIASELDILSIATPQHYGHLGVFPLLHPFPRTPFYLTLDEALAQGVVRVTEVSTGGHVPELLLNNLGDLPILLLDGEELVGAKQNRVLNLTVMAPRKSDLIIPVSCVEQGRWHDVSGAFAAAPRVQYSASRAAKVASVSQSLAAEGRAVSDQPGVWRDIAMKAGRLGFTSETGAMADLFQSAEPQIDAYVRAFSAMPGQTGAVFALGGEVVGLELFDAPATFAKLLPKLVRSYALDALECPGPASPVPPLDGASALLRQVATAEVGVFPGVGVGQAIRLRGPALVGAGLVVDNALVHLAAFRRAGNASGGGERRPGWMTRASRRFE
jgi:hypothetical protein